MAQDVDVVVTPEDYKYSFESIKIICGPTDDSERYGLQVPVHVYASGNKLVEKTLPPIVDFGKVPVGEVAERRFILRCDVPLEFDFEVLHLRRHPDIAVVVDRTSITPEVPAELRVEYRPTSFTTAVAEVEVVLAQFGGEPTRRMKKVVEIFVLIHPGEADGKLACNRKEWICGTCVPGLRKDREKAKGLFEIERRRQQVHDASIVRRVGKLMEKSKNRKVARKTVVRGTTHRQRERTVGGIYLPEVNTGGKLTQNETAYVLMQRAGKVPLRHLRRYIEQVKGGEVKERERKRRKDRAIRKMGEVLWRAVVCWYWSAWKDSYDAAKSGARRAARRALAEEVREKAAAAALVDDDDDSEEEESEGEVEAVVGVVAEATTVGQEVDDDYEKDSRVVEVRRLIEERGVGPVVEPEEEESSSEEEEGEYELSEDAKLLIEIAEQLEKERKAEEVEASEESEEVIEEPVVEVEGEQKQEEEEEVIVDIVEEDSEEVQVAVESGEAVEETGGRTYLFREPVKYDFTLGRGMLPTLAFGGALLAGRTARRPRVLEDFTKWLCRVRVLEDTVEENVLSDTDSDDEEESWEVPLCGRDEAMASFGLENFNTAGVIEEDCDEIGRVQQANRVIRKALKRMGEELKVYSVG
ncbi:hypothetical protein Pmar_PMAR006406 [Perkinsus marinus ATCC 50983]|uniref:Uncharacterized protein n=1 Tax=Perkinsus marinus (strain ATCC 50983 / TXsc) TaxID=423536 RepID=C5K9L4_PERM5|nr:hypothetical protein Pmar_PMAR006406 [Perkinsus marinus ATCC 50983]EER18786.1 hypothetical protein Pmar_PMAR006406 [Perkinsus marinus ATCC 50983]|eukprot:XP_002786990.1 hypothetical protein Pmar_PMAR006406 [Perkinsus marinus ATCC 50983]